MSSLHDAVTRGGDYVRLEPPRATQGELQLTNKLHMIRVGDDVNGVVEHLRGIDPHLVLWYDFKVEIFVLQWEGFRQNGDRWDWCEDLVGAYKCLDQRLINLIERIDKQNRGHTDLVEELDRLDREMEAAKRRAFADRTGDAAERLRHALRRDLGVEGSSVMMGSSRGIQKARKEQRRRQKRARKANR